MAGKAWKLFLQLLKEIEPQSVQVRSGAYSTIIELYVPRRGLRLPSRRLDIEFASPGSWNLPVGKDFTRATVCCQQARDQHSSKAIVCILVDLPTATPARVRDVFAHYCTARTAHLVQRELLLQSLGRAQANLAAARRQRTLTANALADFNRGVQCPR
jgi:hypothetical protein